MGAANVDRETNQKCLAEHDIERVPLLCCGCRIISGPRPQSLPIFRGVPEILIVPMFEALLRSLSVRCSQC